MQKRNNKNVETDKNIITLILRINGEENEISSIDFRKFELINYYVRQRNDGKSAADSQMKQIADTLSKSFTEAIEVQYKKYVPKTVREMYDGFLSKSLSFGAVYSEDTVSPMVEQNDNE